MIRRSKVRSNQVLVTHKSEAGHRRALAKYREDAILFTFATDHEWCIELRPTWSPGEAAPRYVRDVERAARVRID